MSYNTIRLIHGSLNCPRHIWLKKVNPGDSILECDHWCEEVMRWSIEQEAAAQKELSRRKCTYFRIGDTVYADEYALEYCECDEDGEFIEGSDYELATQEKEM